MQITLRSFTPWAEISSGFNRSSISLALTCVRTCFELQRCCCCLSESPPLVWQRVAKWQQDQRVRT